MPTGSEPLVCAYCLHEGIDTPAVTSVAGTSLCADHARTELAQHRMRHD